MSLICPNCKSKLVPENWYDKKIKCNKCKNVWVRSTKYGNSDYINMIDERIAYLGISEEEYSVETGVDIRKLKEILTNYDYFVMEIYKEISKATGKTIRELTEILLIKLEDYDSYREEKIKDIHKNI